MNLNKMNRDIRKYDKQVEELLAKRRELAEQRDREMAAQAQKNFAKTRIEPERLMLLLHAKGEQLEKLIHEIELEQGLSGEGAATGAGHAQGDDKEERKEQEYRAEDGKEQENGAGKETVI